MPEVLILGGTDLTLKVAEAVLETGFDIAAIVDVGESFSISYNKSGVRNTRHANLTGWCRERNIEHLPFTNYDDLASRLTAREIPVCLVAGWYHMIPRQFRERFPLGCLGFHASLLPQLRGGAPLNWAILSGLEETGITLFEIAEGVDTGLIYAQSRFVIGPRTTIGELVEASSQASASMIRQYLKPILESKLKPNAQTGNPTYGLQRNPGDGRINWSHPADAIDRLVRATSRPYPGAFTALNDIKVVIWSVEVLKEAPCVFGAPGQLFTLPEMVFPCVVTGDIPLAISDATDSEGTDLLDLLRRSGHQRFSY